MIHREPNPNDEPFTPEFLLQIQQRAGNQAALRLLRAVRQAEKAPAGPTRRDSRSADGEAEVE